MVSPIFLMILLRLIGDLVETIQAMGRMTSCRVWKILKILNLLSGSDTVDEALAKKLPTLIVACRPGRGGSPVGGCICTQILLTRAVPYHPSVSLNPLRPRDHFQAFLEVWAGHCGGHMYQKFMN
jgi:hypothetical protein